MNSILITGGSRGIGRATAVLCGARGWSVTFNYREDSTAAQQTVLAVESSGAHCQAVKADITQEREVVSLFDAAEGNFGVVTGVVLNAGVVAPSMELADMSGARLANTFAVNVYGTFLCAREAARRMSIKRGGTGGSIVIVSSVASRIGSPFEYIDYAAGKAALDTLGLGLSKELAQEGVAGKRGSPGHHRYADSRKRRAA